MKQVQTLSDAKLKQESIPVGCVPPACKLYVFQRPPPDVTVRRGSEPVQCGPMNKFAQVFNDDHQISLAGDRTRREVLCLKSGRGGGVGVRGPMCVGAGGLYWEANASWVMVTWDSRVNKMMDRHNRKHYLPATSLAVGKY